MGRQSLRIACNNAFWFQGVPFEPDEPGPPVAEIFDALVERYRSLRADLLCLQEVQSPEVAEMLGAAVGMPARYCPGRVRSQYGVATLTALAVSVEDWRNRDVSVDRAWQVVTLQEGPFTGLRVANVHLPSGRQTGPEETVLLKKTELGDVLSLKPDVVCGDMNEQPGGLVCRIMHDAGYLDAAEAMGRADLVTNIAGRRGDFIFVRSDGRFILRAYGVVDRDRWTGPTGSKAFLSDHLPLWIDLAC